MDSRLSPKFHKRRRYTVSDSQIPPLTANISNVEHISTSRRQAAESQLETLLNEDDNFLPFYVRQASDNSLSGRDISIEEIAKKLNSQEFIIRRLVSTLNLSSNEENSSTISENVAQKLTRVLIGTMDVRALIFFKMLDENHDQYIDKRELIQFYTSYLNSIQTFNMSCIPHLMECLITRYHLDTNCRLHFDQFYSILTTDKTLLESFSQFSVGPLWLMNSSETKSHENIIRSCLGRFFARGDLYHERSKRSTLDYIKNNLPRVIIIILYILMNIGLIIYVIIYRAVIQKLNVFLVFARICGMLLNFHGSLAIALMLKQTILLIRSTKFHTWLPLDDHIDFHKFVGRFIGVLSLIHTIAHILNFITLKKYALLNFFFTIDSKLGWIKGFAPLSGVILCVIVLIMLICSMHWVRRGGYFQVFYWSHLLYVLFLVFSILHAGNFWKWAIGPTVLFILEKCYSLLTRYSTNYGRTYIRSAKIEQSNVISLMIHRPRNFRFRPGDYILINCPQVALYEFHPFTISSAPEELDHLDIHIQAVGNWTKGVYERFKYMSEDEHQTLPIQAQSMDSGKDRDTLQTTTVSNTIVEVENEENRPTDNLPSVTTSHPDENRKQKEIVIVKGPYSTCARYIFNNRHVVLIGSGIGITPYASILSSLMAQFRASRTVCKHCSRFNYNENSLWEHHRLEKVDFVWVSRDSKSFQWFINLLQQFEREQEDYLSMNNDESRFLDIHLYFTGVKVEQSIDNFFLQHVTNIWAEETGSDIFTGLKSRTNFGRPDWEKFLRNRILGGRDCAEMDTSVFFCGLKTVGKVVEQHCINLGIRYYEEKF